MPFQRAHANTSGTIIDYIKLLGIYYNKVWLYEIILKGLDFELLIINNYLLFKRIFKPETHNKFKLRFIYICIF